MSRVEQAYRRVGRLDQGEPALDGTDVVAFGAVLDKYPRENGTKAAGRSPVAAEPVKPVEATKPVEASSPSVWRPAERPEGHRAETSTFDGARLVTGGADVIATGQYSRLAAALHDAQVEQGLRSLMVTSAIPREGKTLTATNLAITFAELYTRRVLLIDADFRRPSIHQVLGLSNRSGLGEVLRSDRPSLPVTEVTSHLSVLLAGRPDASPMAALSSDCMKGVLEQAASLYDWVVVDTPPVGLMPDANLIARWLDGVLLVIAARTTPYRRVQDALETLGSERIVGTILNKADQAAVSTDYYGLYYQSESS